MSRASASPGKFKDSMVWSDVTVDRVRLLCAWKYAVPPRSKLSAIGSACLFLRFPPLAELDDAPSVPRSPESLKLVSASPSIASASSSPTPSTRLDGWLDGVIVVAPAYPSSSSSLDSSAGGSGRFFDFGPAGKRDRTALVVFDPRLPPSPPAVPVGPAPLVLPRRVLTILTALTAHPMSLR